MKIVSLNQIKKIRPDMAGAAGVYKQIPISREIGTPNFSFRVFTIEPGGHTPFHKHPFEHLNYIIDGTGVLVSDNSEQQLRKGDFALILPDEMHQYKNSSKNKSLVMICAVPKEFE